MRVTRDELAKHQREIPPPPPPIEPRLSPQDEARLLARSRPDDPAVRARRERVLALIRRPAPLEGADAELITLLAAAKALPIDRAQDSALARTRLTEIGRMTDPPPAVADLMRRNGITPGESFVFAEKLLPHRHVVDPATTIVAPGPG